MGCGQSRGRLVRVADPTLAREVMHVDCNGNCHYACSAGERQTENLNKHAAVELRHEQNHSPMVGIFEADEEGKSDDSHENSGGGKQGSSATNPQTNSFSHTQKALARQREKAKHNWSAVRKNLAKAVLQEAKHCAPARHEVSTAAAKFRWSGLGSGILAGLEAQRPVRQADGTQASQTEVIPRTGSGGPVICRTHSGAPVHPKQVKANTGLYEGMAMHDNDKLLKKLKETYEQKVFEATAGLPTSQNDQDLQVKAIWNLEPVSTPSADIF